jgi:quaternary ammonium compound-resistance protein SugE
MAWIYLVVAGLFEIGWPLGMKLAQTANGIRLWPLGMSIASMAASGWFLYLAQRTLPMGTAYAVWTGIGALGTFFLGLAVFKEPATAARFLCVAVIAGGIIGLKLVSDAAPAAP